MRVTQHMIYRNFVTNLKYINEALKENFEKIAAGKKIIRPSDDPFGTTKALNYRSRLAETEQYQRNIQRAISWQNVTETALKGMEDILLKVQEIAISQGSDNASAETRAMLAGQVGELKKQAYQIANTKLGNQYIFAGYKTNTPPFVETDNNYHGDEGKIKIDVSPFMQLSFNVSGSIFAPDTATTPTPQNSIFQLLDDLKTALENNDASTVRSLVGDINETFKRINTAQANLGSVMNRFENVKNELMNVNLDLINLIAETEDADLAESSANLAMYQTVYQSTLAGMARVIQTNLFTYLG
ncbi:MAG: flagellar hook-associated protein FlgL [Candidatus Desulfofervidaceae bacterium]|nr:flagellar hook-associated protein FlgL [Candidatus Desulfofervidaceae bacterium]MDL1970623.1 flagellar hook-associated protein FlgL [Candidatus Desulfofervidaceae bacterium]